MEYTFQEESTQQEAANTVASYARGNHPRKRELSTRAKGLEPGANGLEEALYDPLSLEKGKVSKGKGDSWCHSVFPFCNLERFRRNESRRGKVGRRRVVGGR